MRYKLTMSYDGSLYSGFQRQKQAPYPTIQATLEDTMTMLFKEPVIIHGSGRTDGRVHALAQVAHVDLTNQVPAERMRYALNRVLPASIVITDVEVVDDTFHARKSAVGKRYRYDLCLATIPPAIGHQYFTHVPRKFNQADFATALASAVGRHNFEGFCAHGSSVKTYEREIFVIDIEDHSPFLSVRFIGDGFLRKMVRNIMGTAINTAIGDLPVDQMAKAIASHKRSDCGPTAAPQGLFLEKVYYDLQGMKKDIAFFTEKA